MLSPGTAFTANRLVYLWGVRAGLTSLQHTAPIGVSVSSVPDKPLILRLLDAFRLALFDHDTDLAPSAARGYCHHCVSDAGYHFVSQQYGLVIDRHVFIIAPLTRYVNHLPHGWSEKGIRVLSST